MKIYIETDMTEMPKGCADCPNTADGRKSLIVCQYGMRHISNTFADIPKSRPDWCPLRREYSMGKKLQIYISDKVGFKELAVVGADYDTEEEE